MNESLADATVGEIVARDFRSASVFEQFGIDFCCGGRQSVAEACRAAKVDATVVGQALAALPPVAGSGNEDVTAWPLDRLADYIVKTHHAYVRAALPVIAAHLTKLVAVHGARHPELESVVRAFDDLSRDLLQHMLKEERVLFPYLRRLSAADGRPLTNPFGSVRNPIQMMAREHQQAGDEMRLIREITNGYTMPADGCATYRVTLAALALFERDLHQHVHLENNVLFPKAIEREHSDGGR